MRRLSELEFRQQLVVIAVVAIFIILVFSLLIRPKISQLNQISASQEEEEQRFKALNTTLVRLKDIKKRAQKIKAEVERMGKLIPETPEVPSLILEIQDIANQADMEFQKIKPSPLVEKGEYAELPLEITVDGYFYDLVDFLYRMEKLSRAIKITKIQISEGKQKLPHLSTNLTVNAFVLTKGRRAKK